MSYKKTVGSGAKRQIGCLPSEDQRAARVGSMPISAGRQKER